MKDDLIALRLECAFMQDRAEKTARDDSRPMHVQECNWAIQDVLGVVLDRIDKILKKEELNNEHN